MMTPYTPKRLVRWLRDFLNWIDSTREKAERKGVITDLLANTLLLLSELFVIFVFLVGAVFLFLNFFD